jgi:hypothetical protein
MIDFEKYVRETKEIVILERNALVFIGFQWADEQSASKIFLGRERFMVWNHW